ncbi:MAG: DUF2946 domain-containing protein [Pseudazoarcus pumilus]|nr:DUF2946 domain-containing protein [Pseudazoarcus pumilus]
MPAPGSSGRGFSFLACGFFRVCRGRFCLRYGVGIRQNATSRDRFEAMRRLVSLQRSIARLLMLVMLAAALFPVLAHASASVHGPASGWIEVCTVNGVETRAAPAQDDPARPAMLVEHCPYCLVSSLDDLLPPVSASPVVPAERDGSHVLPALPLPPAATVWSAAHPRAPPALV